MLMIRDHLDLSTDWCLFTWSYFERRGYSVGSNISETTETSELNVGGYNLL